MLDAKDKIYMWPIIHFGLQSLSRTCLTSLVWITEPAYTLTSMLTRKSVPYTGFTATKPSSDFLSSFKNNWLVFNITHNLFVKSPCMFSLLLCVLRWLLSNLELGEVGAAIGGRRGSLPSELERWDCSFLMDIWDGKNKSYDGWIKKKIIPESKNVKGMCVVRYSDKAIGSVL